MCLCTKGIEIFLIFYDKPCQHKSGSNQGSEYIAIFHSSISSSLGQHLKTYTVQSVRNSNFHPTEDVDANYVQEESQTLKIYQFYLFRK